MPKQIAITAGLLFLAVKGRANLFGWREPCGATNTVRVVDSLSLDLGYKRLALHDSMQVQAKDNHETTARWKQNNSHRFKSSIGSRFSGKTKRRIIYIMLNFILCI